MDLTLLKWLNRLGANPTLDYAAWIITEYPAAVLAIPVLYYLLFPPGPRRVVTHSVVLATLVALLAYGAVDTVSLVDQLERERPHEALPEQVQGRQSEVDAFSFPSRLTVVTTAIAVIMWRGPGKTARWVFAAVAMWAAISRPMMGLNWPSDIVGSMLLGWLLARLMYWLTDPSSRVRQWFLDS